MHSPNFEMTPSHNNGLNGLNLKNGGDLLVAIAAHVTEGRIPLSKQARATATHSTSPSSSTNNSSCGGGGNVGAGGALSKGFMEGPHCSLGNANYQHVCDPSDYLCQKYTKTQSKVNSLCEKGVPFCVEVHLIPPNCPTCLKESVEDLLLEQWYFHTVPIRANEAIPFQLPQLLSAIRSQLHFSQLSAWLSSSSLSTSEECGLKITNNNIRYSLTIPGETFETSDFRQQPTKHNFPKTLLGNGLALSVTLVSLPRTSTSNLSSTFNCESCKKQQQDDETNKGNKKDNLENDYEDEDEKMCDDRMYTPCTINGKHRCDELEEELVEGTKKRLCRKDKSKDKDTKNKNKEEPNKSCKRCSSNENQQLQQLTTEDNNSSSSPPHSSSHHSFSPHSSLAHSSSPHSSSPHSSSPHSSSPHSSSPHSSSPHTSYPQSSSHHSSSPRSSYPSSSSSLMLYEEEGEGEEEDKGEMQEHQLNQQQQQQQQICDTSIQHHHHHLLLQQQKQQKMMNNATTKKQEKKQHQCVHKNVNFNVNINNNVSCARMDDERREEEACCSSSKSSSSTSSDSCCDKTMFFNDNIIIKQNNNTTGDIFRISQNNCSGNSAASTQMKKKKKSSGDKCDAGGGDEEEDGDRDEDEEDEEKDDFSSSSGSKKEKLSSTPLGCRSYLLVLARNSMKLGGGKGKARQRITFEDDDDDNEGNVLRRDGNRENQALMNKNKLGGIGGEGSDDGSSSSPSSSYNNVNGNVNININRNCSLCRRNRRAGSSSLLLSPSWIGACDCYAAAASSLINGNKQETQNRDKDKDGGSGSNLIPSMVDQVKFRKSFDNAASMVFHSRTGLPLTSSPAPIRRGKAAFDFDSSINSVSAIKSALFSVSFSTDDESESDGSIVSPCSPEILSAASVKEPPPFKYRRKGHSGNLLGTFEESVLNGRLEPVSTVHGFRAELGASGSFVPRHLHCPVTVFFYNLGDSDKVSSPYLGHINLGKKGYNVPRVGTIQVTLFNPLGTVVKMFVIVYDLSDMPPNAQTFIRQRTLYMPTNTNKKDQNNKKTNGLEFGPKYLRYLIHLRFTSSKSGKIYLHSDIRMIIFRQSDLDTATAHGREMSYELQSFLHMPSDPKYSLKKTPSSPPSSASTSPTNSTVTTKTNSSSSNIVNSSSSSSTSSS